MSSCNDAGSVLAWPAKCCTWAAVVRKPPLAGSSAPYGVITAELGVLGASIDTARGIPSDEFGESAVSGISGATVRALPQMPQKASAPSKKSLPQTEHMSPERVPLSLPAAGDCSD